MGDKMSYRTAKRVPRITALIAICLVTGIASATDLNTWQEQDFLTTAFDSGKAEIAFGLMAADRAESEKVKQFGKRMVKDHQKAGMEMKQLALQEGIDLPAGMTPSQKEHAAMFSQLSGEQFDRAYINHMVIEHVNDVIEFEYSSAQGLKSPRVQQWASRTLPVLKEHLATAKNIASELEPLISDAMEEGQDSNNLHRRDRAVKRDAFNNPLKKGIHAGQN